MKCVGLVLASLCISFFPARAFAEPASRSKPSAVGFVKDAFNDYRQQAIDSRVRSELRNAATAQEAHFVDNDTYVSCEGKSCEVLPGFRHSEDVTVKLKASPDGKRFTGEAYSSNGRGEHYYWDYDLGFVDKHGNKIKIERPKHRRFLRRNAPTPGSPEEYDQLAKRSVRNLATSQEAYFVDNDKYASCKNQECETKLPGFRLEPSIAVEARAKSGGRSVVCTAKSAKGSGVSFVWDSKEPGVQVKR